MASGSTGARESNRIDDELLTRTSWVNAEVAYNKVNKGRYAGNKRALWLRMHLQMYLCSLGYFIQLHCGKVTFVGLLLLSLCCVGLKTSKMETNVEELWVEEGGRLEKEVEYTKNIIGEGSESTSEILIQTKNLGKDILTPDSLLTHLKAVLMSTQIEIEYKDNKTGSMSNWNFRDLCYLAAFPQLEIFFSQTLTQIMPCVVITPLDCFWEGSKVLGPHYPVSVYGEKLRWKTLNPLLLLRFMKNIPGNEVIANTIEEAFNRSGISTGYMEKPCLNPYDPECPMSSPNKLTLKPPDIGAELTGGCTGFSTKFMKWKPELIVGGIRKNKSYHIVKAEALQSIIQLIGEKDLYEFLQGTSKTQHMDWSQDVAREIIQKWQRKFSEQVNKLTNGSSKDNIYAFSTTSLADIMSDFSKLHLVQISLGYLLMLIYACVSLLCWNNAANSQSTVGMIGVLLIALSVAAGLGMCSLLGIKFNAATTQIIPFLALGLGIDDMFIIAHTYAENFSNSHIGYMDQTGECLKRVGVSVLLTSLNNILALFSAAIIPIPALRAFSLQTAILFLFNLGTMLLIYPAIVSLDLRRRNVNRMDFFCCWHSSNANRVLELQPNYHEQSSSSCHESSPSSPPSPPPSYSPPPCYSPPPPPNYRETINGYTNANPTSVTQQHSVTQTTSADGGQVVTTLAMPGTAFFSRHPSLTSVCTSTTSSRQCLASEENTTSCHKRCIQTQRECFSWTLSRFAKQYYAPYLQKTPVKVFVIVLFIQLLSIGIWGSVKVKEGLQLTDVVPRNTKEYRFLEAQSKYFAFYHFFAVTKADFDYANKQPLLHSYNKAFQRIKNIVTADDGLLPLFWLELFQQWLRDLQREFDEQVLLGNIHSQGWYHNASDNGILAYKLLVQTGSVDSPINKKQVLSQKLVDGKGIIYPPAFYNYLTAWTSIDAIAYDSSMADLHPKPKLLTNDRYEDDLTIPKSPLLTYAQLSFYLNDLDTNDEMIDTVRSIRDICDNFQERGLPNYPRGVPFTYWEQYLKLRMYMSLALVCILAVTFIVLAISLMSFWMAGIVVTLLAMMVVELFGFMGLMGLKLSAIPAVILIISVGIGIEFILHVTMGYLTSIGSRNKRMAVSLQHTLAPVIHGALSTFLGIIMLVGSEFDFIVKYFFNVLSILVLLGLVNGLILLPVLLSMIGPPAEIVVKDDEERISPPTPEPVRAPSRTKQHQRVYPRGMISDISLSTISEEPTQYSAHEIIVQPEVIVETTTMPMETYMSSECGGHRGGGSESTSNIYRSANVAGATGYSPPSKHVTRVKTTTTVKVEVHTPLPGSVQQEHMRKGSQQEHSYKSRRRKRAWEQNSDTTEPRKVWEHNTDSERRTAWEHNTDTERRPVWEHNTDTELRPVWERNTDSTAPCSDGSDSDPGSVSQC